MKRHIIESLIIAIVFTAGSYGLALGLGWVASVNLLEAFAVFTSYVCTWLCVRERRINYPIGAISTAAYCVLFWQSGLIASMILNAYLTPSLLYGWFRWRRDEVKRPVTRLNVKWLPVYLGVTGLAYIGVLLIVGALGATLAVTDTVILVGSILAQFLLDNKKLSTWYVWAIVNIFAIYTYFMAGLPLAGFQYVTFLLNTGVGWYVWRRSMTNAQETMEIQHAFIRTYDSTTAHDGTLAANPVQPVLSTDDGYRLNPAVRAISQPTL